MVDKEDEKENRTIKKDGSKGDGDKKTKIRNLKPGQILLSK
jgi:hypothetical protein